MVVVVVVVVVAVAVAVAVVVVVVVVVKQCFPIAPLAKAGAASFSRSAKVWNLRHKLCA